MGGIQKDWIHGDIRWRLINMDMLDKGIHAYTLWFPSHIKNIHFKNILKLAFPQQDCFELIILGSPIFIPICIIEINVFFHPQLVCGKNIKHFITFVISHLEHLFNFEDNNLQCRMNNWYWDHAKEKYVHMCFHLWNFFVFFQHFWKCWTWWRWGWSYRMGAHQYPWNPLS